jgi:7-carboxy-7-deazaguanine synthase
MANKIPVLEIFGPTIQGEGSVMGVKTMFVRTAGCDYSCSWCDSAFTWDGSAKDEIRQMTAEEIMDELKRTGGDQFSHVTLSGGNPLLLANHAELIRLLKENKIRIAVETQGTKWQPWLTDIDDVTISPKAPSSGMITNFGLLDAMINNLAEADRLQNTSLKIVVFDEADFEFAKDIHLRYPDLDFFLQVGNEDTSTGDNMGLLKQLLSKYEWLIDLAMQSKEMNDARVLPQLHTFLWGNKRGV